MKPTHQLVLCIVLLLAFASCKKSDDKTTTPVVTCTPYLTTITDSSGNIYDSLVRDAASNIVKITHSGGSYQAFLYTGTRCDSLVNYDTVGNVYTRYGFKYDADNRMIYYTAAYATLAPNTLDSFIYSKGVITQRKEYFNGVFTQYYNYQYDAEGNISQVDTYFDRGTGAGFELSTTSTFHYDNNINPQFSPIPASAYYGKHNVVTEVITGNSPSILSYVYTYDSTNRPITKDQVLSDGTTNPARRSYYHYGCK